MKTQNTPELIFLLDRTATGDREAFAELYDRTSGGLYGIVLAITGNGRAAETVLAEAYQRIWTRAGAYDPGTTLPGLWMANLARNAALDHLARQREHRPDHQPDHWAEPAQPKLEAGDGYTRGTRLGDCLANLPDGVRDMVLSAYYGGIDPALLARRGGEDEADVRARLRRAVIELKRCIDG